MILDRLVARATRNVIITSRNFTFNINQRKKRLKKKTNYVQVLKNNSHRMDPIEAYSTNGILNIFLKENGRQPRSVLGDVSETEERLIA